MKVRAAMERSSVNGRDCLWTLTEFSPFACIPDRRLDREIALSHVQLKIDGRIKRTRLGQVRFVCREVHRKHDLRVLQRADANTKPILGLDARGHLPAKPHLQPVARSQGTLRLD